MAKACGLSISLFLIFNADPKMTGCYRLIRPNGELPKFQLLLSVVQHAGMNKANVRNAPKLFSVILHGFLDLDAQCGTRVVVEP